MNKRFFNQQNLTRRLRLLSVLFAMLLMPLGAWAEDYPITVAGIQVTSDNATDIVGDGITEGKVTFTSASGDNPATLTLNGATLGGAIVLQSGLDDLTIHLLGENKIQGADYQNPLENGIKRENGATTGTLTFTTAEGASGTLFFPYVTTPIEGFSNIAYNNELEWGCDSYVEGNKVCTNFYEGVGTNVVLASASWQDCITKSQTMLSLNNGATITFREDNSLGRVLTLSGFTDYISSICWYSHSDVKFEINGTNSFKFENPMLVGNDQSNVSFIATGTSAATLRFWHKGNGANRLDLSVPFISGFKNSANPGLGEGLYNVDVLESRIDPDNNYTDDFTEHYITTEAYGLKVSGVRVHNLDGVYKGHKDHILGEKEEGVFNTSVTFAPATTTLTLNGAEISHLDEENAIISSLSTPLYVHLLGENTIDSKSYLPFEGATGDDADLVFTTTSDNPGSLTMTSSHAGFGKTTFYTGFNEVQYPEDSGFLYAKEESGNVIISQNQSYSLTIAGVDLTKDNVSADGTVTGIAAITAGTVKYTPADNTASPATPATLTLTNATIIPTTECAGIKYTGTDNLVISLNGTNNVVKGGGNCNAILYDGTGVTALTLTFTNGGTAPCSLQLEAVGEQTIDGFGSVVNTGLYKIDETILGGDQPNTYKTTITSLGGGSGTSSDPIIIKTAEDLRDFAKLVNRGTITNKYIKLNPEGGELDCNGLTGFEPIGIYGNPFIGKFDGNNCTIKNLTYSTNGTGDRVGLFGYVCNDDVSDTKIEKLTLSNCSFNGGEYVGGIVGELSNGTIENCALSSCTVKSGNAQIPYAGGIAGKVENGTISTCTFNSGLVDCTTAYSAESSNGVHAGGIVGAIETANSVTVSSCIVSSTNVKGVHSGAEYGPFYIYAGGLVGRSSGTVAISDNKVTTTDNTKKISCQSGVDYTKYLCGAIIGEKRDETTLTNNTYEYDVTTDIAGTTKSGYTQRGMGGTTNNEQTQQEEPNPDVFTNNGAVMDTRLLAMPGESSPVKALGDEGGYYAYATGSTYGILGAPGKPVKVTINPNGNTITDVSVTYGTDQTATITKTKTEEGISFYTISEMPDADDATLNVTCDIAYDLWIGETQVTDANKDHILGEGNTSVKFAVTGNEAAGYVNTLMLDNANFTGNIQWTSSEDLIVNLVGSNEITIANANDYVFVGNAATATPKLTLTTDESEPGTLKVNGLTEKTSIASGWSASSSKFVYASDDYPADGDWWVQSPVGSDYMNITLNRKYDLWISGTQYCDANLDPIAGAKFVPGSSTLEYGYTGSYSFISSLPALTVKVTTNTAQMGTITFQSKGDVISGTLTFEAKDTDGKYSLSLSNDDGGPAISGFSSVNFTSPMHLIDLETDDLATASDVEISNYDSYNLQVGDIDVTSLNSDNVLNNANATVKYNYETNTLTLNNAAINGGIFCGREEALTVHLLGSNVIDGQYDETNGGGVYAFSAENCEGLTFTTDENAPGQLVMKNTKRNEEGGYPQYYDYDGFEDVEYKNGLTAADNDTDKKELIATAPLISPAEGVYWPDQEYIITGFSDATLKYYYRDTVTDPFVETTASSFTMENIGRHLVRAAQTLTVDGTSFEMIGGDKVYIVRNALTFDLPTGIYGGTQNVKIENLPEGYDNTYDYTQVWYYLGENKNDSVQYTSADQTIAVSESTKVTAYIIDGDSGKQFKSEKTEVEYTIKANPNLRFTYIQTNVKMGETFSQEVKSDMETTPTVTWSSSNEAVATVDPNTGVVTPVAVYGSNIQITATFAGDDTYAPATASYDVKVVQGENYLFIQYKGESTTLAKVRVTKGKTLNIKENYNLICPAEIAGDLTWTPDASTIATVDNEGVVSGVSCGNTRIVVAFAGNDNYKADTYEFYVDVAPLAPTIELETGTYPSTHAPITITKENIDGTAISYTWGNITGNNNAEWTDYTDAGVTFQAGTLSAKVGYTPGDYGEVIYSDTVSVVYYVLADPELAYKQGETAVTTAEWTLGKDDNTALPTLQNPYNVPVTYESGNTAIATVAADGTVTPVGVGSTTITATSTATTEYAVGEASYTLNVYKSLSHSSITVEISEVTYNGQAQTPTVTVKDGDNVLPYGEDNGGGTMLYAYKVEFANNTNAALATAETNAPTATITALTDGSVSHMEVNWYRGSTTKTFTINKAQLTVTPDDKTYNVGDNIELTVSYDGFVDGDDEDVLTTEPTASYGTADVTKPGSYEITASGGVAQNYDFIYATGTLTINRVLDVSFASNTWATYCGTENLATPEGLQAYQVTAVGTSAVTTSAIDYIPANTAVLLKDVEGKAASANIAASAYTGVLDPTICEDNILQGGVAVDVSSITGGTVYVLYKDKFKRATGGTIPANRGYLVVAPSSGNAPELSITIGDDTTGIGTVGCDSVATDNDEWYTLDGQKLQQAPTQKGLYIKNGKKVVINKK